MDVSVEFFILFFCLFAMLGFLIYLVQSSVEIKKRLREVYKKLYEIEEGFQQLKNETLLQTPIDSQRTQIFVTPPTEETPRKFTQMQNSKNYEFVSLFTTNGHPSSPTIESQLLPQAPNPPTVPALPPKISKSKSFNKLEANESEYIAMNNPNSNLPMNHKTKKYVPKLGISSSEIRETTYISMHNSLKGKSDNEIDKEGIYLDMSGKYRERTSSEPESYILKTKNIKAKY